MNRQPSASDDSQRSGRSILDVLSLPVPLAELVNWIMRGQGASLEEASAHTGEDEATTLAMLRDLVDQGFLQEVEEDRGPRFRALLKSGQRAARLPKDVWNALDE